MSDHEDETCQSVTKEAKETENQAEEAMNQQTVFSGGNRRPTPESKAWSEFAALCESISEKRGEN